MKIPHIYLEDMIDSIELIQKYIGENSEEQFSRNTELQDAVIRRLIVIGEAASKMPDEIKMQSQDIPWRTIIAFRNVAIHDYANIYMSKVWEIYKQDLSSLREQLNKLLNSLPPPPDPNSV